MKKYVKLFEEFLADITLNESYKSSILTDLSNRYDIDKTFSDGNMTFGGLLYDLTTMKLSEVTDDMISVMKPAQAKKLKEQDYVKIYVIDKDVVNKYSEEQDIIKGPRILSIFVGDEIVGVTFYNISFDNQENKLTYDQHFSGQKVSKGKRHLMTASLKNIYTEAKISVLADKCYVLQSVSLDNDLSSYSLKSKRAEARSGAISMMDIKQIKALNNRKLKSIAMSLGDAKVNNLIKRWNKWFIAMSYQFISENTELSMRALERIAQYNRVLFEEIDDYIDTVQGDIGIGDPGDDAKKLVVWYNKIEKTVNDVIDWAEDEPINLKNWRSEWDKSWNQRNRDL